MTKYLYRTDLPPYQRLSKSTAYTVYNHLFLKYPYSKVSIFTKMLIKSNKNYKNLLNNSAGSWDFINLQKKYILISKLIRKSNAINLPF